MDNALLGRSIKIETSVRCDFCHNSIQKGKYGVQVSGDPEEVKAQGIYHGRQCYQAALTDYEEKKKEFDLQEGNGE